MEAKRRAAIARQERHCLDFSVLYLRNVVSPTPLSFQTTLSNQLSLVMRSEIYGARICSSGWKGRHAWTSRLVVVAAVKKSSLRNIACSKTLKVKDGCAEQAKKLCKEIAEIAHAEMKDSSKGILSFEVFQDPFEEQKIHFWERYLNNTQMGRFNTSDAVQKFMKEIQDCLEEPVGLALYDWRNGELGPVCVQGGPKGEGGLDDATGAGGRGASSYSQTSDVVNLADVKRGEEGDSFGMGKRKPFFELPDFKFPWEKKE